MLKVLFENVRTGETLDLDDISESGEGVQAVSGATGFGLPPLEVQWFEGAGDGAQARGYRVTPRDLDIPLFVAVENRAGLKTNLATLSRVVAGAFILKLYEDDMLYRTMEVRRVGGGTYTYGVDTTGETDWQSLITVRAGNPYWLFADATTVTRTPDVDDSFALTNEGAADAHPVWTLHGPLASVTIKNDDTDESFTWTGLLNIGETLVIDTEQATAVADGVNRYNGLSNAPNLFRLAPGDNAVTVTIETTAELVRTNYVTNPTFGNPTHGWTIAGPNTATVTSGQLVVGTVTTVTGRSYVPTTATKVISGLPDGKFVVRLALADPPAGIKSPPTITITTDDATYVTQWGSSRAGTEFVQEFEAGSSVTIQVTDGWNEGSTVPTLLDHVYVGLPGSYFDGGTTDTADVTYAWAGTTNASTSTATAVDDVPSADVEFRARDWMVV